MKASSKDMIRLRYLSFKPILLICPLPRCLAVIKPSHSYKKVGKKKFKDHLLASDTNQILAMNNRIRDLNKLVKHVSNPMHCNQHSHENVVYELLI